MKAVQFKVSIPRWVFCKIFEKIWGNIHLSRFSLTHYVDIPEPQLANAPNEEWVKIKTRLSGICGSEVGLIYLQDSPALTPFLSSPYVLGHENMGIIDEKGKKVKGFEVGDRVIINGVLPCRVRGIEPECELCAQGQFTSCLNFTKGNLSPSLYSFTCRDTGGGWSSHYLAHEFQLYHVPDSVSDEDAMLVEPLTCGLQSISRCYPKDTDTVLIFGAGMIGIAVVAALRALGSKAHIIVLAKYKFQGEWCEKYGADEIIYLRDGDYYEQLAKSLNVTLKKPELGKRVVVDGGADVVYECVGNDTAVNDALRFTKPNGKLALIGLVGKTKKVDWSFSWFKDLTMIGTNAMCTMVYQGERIPTFQLALNFLEEGQLELKPLLSQKFKLEDWKDAIKAVRAKGRHKIVKAAFAFD